MNVNGRERVGARIFSIVAIGQAGLAWALDLQVDFKLKVQTGRRSAPPAGTTRARRRGT
ncbi:hypothetical protein PT2222_70092 [Paraburkholderia tropica]